MARYALPHGASRFAHLAEVLRETGVQKVDGILLDLGVSSPHWTMRPRVSVFVSMRAGYAHGYSQRYDCGAGGCRGR